MENLAQFIPHKPPMHWLDQAWLEEDGSIGARWTIPDDNLVINTLLQANVLPPAAVLEVLAQAAACQAGLSASQAHTPVPGGRLVAIEHLSFGAPIRVGDTLELRISVMRQWQNLLKCRLLARVRGEVAAMGVATFAVVVQGQFP